MGAELGIENVCGGSDVGDKRYDPYDLSIKAISEPQLSAVGRRFPMNLELARHVLLWCTVIDYSVLLWWFLLFRFAHDGMYRLHGRWFRLSVEQFDAIHYAAMAIYKIGILLFNLVPYVVLLIVA